LGYRITFLPDGRTVEAAEGETILRAAGRDGIHINATCGGKGTCGRCRVILKEGKAVSPESSHLTDKDRAEGILLACQSVPASDLTVEIPATSQMRNGSKIATGSRLEEMLAAAYGACAGKFRPITVKFHLQLPTPSLDDNISDFERLKRELEKSGYNAVSVRAGLPAMQKMGRVMRDEGWSVTVTLLEDGNTVEVIDIEPGDTSATRYAAAADIGTTSVVVYLVDLITGKVLDHASAYNTQVRCGEDVITRIVYATEQGGLSELQQLVVSLVNELVGKLCAKHNIGRELLDTAIISGNTTMTHLFFGIDPAYIREEPYIPTAAAFPVLPASAVGLLMKDTAVVYAMPGVASYVGGDITSGVLASGLYKQPGLSLFIDIGTNGEIVLGGEDWIVTAACSAGPAFEGGGVKFGMRAMDGAIERVAIDPGTLAPGLTVIGGSKPVGICGSGMIDAIGEMFLAGIIDQRGKVNTTLDNPRVRVGENGPEYVLAWADETGIGADITLTEPDVNNIVRTKGAIYAGFATLLKEVGFTFADVDRVYIAGGFGHYLNIERAVIIGLLPDLPAEKFEFLGNTSIMGAYLALLSRKFREDAEAIAHRMTYIELSVSRNFMDEYVSALFLPHTHIDEFPSVKKLLG
jgi:uncharacterized 2Fe-2S/4Fe-4S cluster protein (DUF4445 family)